jgi:hypothetical protein
MMSRLWVKPAFEVASVNGECTAYAGVKPVVSVSPLPASSEAAGPCGAIGRVIEEEGRTTAPADASR